MFLERHRLDLSHRRRLQRRRWRAALRDTWVLVREFQGALVLFVAALLLGGLSFQVLWNTSGREPIRFIEAVYDVLTMIFFQPVIDFPKEWYLDLYFFLMPALGLAILGRGAADFVALLFNRRSRQGSWEEAVASTYNNHVIVCGLGHLGLRVVRELVALDEDVVVVERNAQSTRFEEVRQFEIPIIVGDALRLDTLEKARIHQAEAFIICTNNDLMNLQIAAKVREINQEVRLVIRMFDDEFATAMSGRFKFSAAMSASALAAPAFAGAAIQTEIIQVLQVGEQRMVMSRLEVCARSHLDGMTIAQVETELDLSIVLLQSGDHVDVHPEPDVVVQAGDCLAVLATLPVIHRLARLNRVAQI